MKAYTFTKTSGGNCYLYNSKKSTLLNVHPIIETLKGVDKNDEKDVLFAKIKKYTSSNTCFYEKKVFLKILTKQISSMERYQPKS